MLWTEKQTEAYPLFRFRVSGDRRAGGFVSTRAGASPAALPDREADKPGCASATKQKGGLVCEEKNKYDHSL